jgi:hypothetical protein
VPAPVPVPVLVPASTCVSGCVRAMAEPVQVPKHLHLWSPNVRRTHLDWRASKVHKIGGTSRKCVRSCSRSNVPHTHVLMSTPHSPVSFLGSDSSGANADSASARDPKKSSSHASLHISEWDDLRKRMLDSACWVALTFERLLKFGLKY